MGWLVFVSSLSPAGSQGSGEDRFAAGRQDEGRLTNGGQSGDCLDSEVGDDRRVTYRT